MNIFWLDTDPTKLAEYHCDKHIVKMPTECGQMMSDAMARYGLEGPHRLTNPNHPCTKWAGDGNLNYMKLRELALALCLEYTKRYGKVHKIQRRMEAGEYSEKLPIPGPDIGTPPPNCTTIKEYSAPLNIVDLYRMYYIRDKKPNMDFKYYRGTKEEPEFMGDRFYEQQIKAVGDCPGNPKNKGKPAKAPTKPEMVELLGIPGLDKLRIPELQALLLVWESPKELTPQEGRLKKPYVSECAKLTDAVDWNRCTVVTLKEVIKKMS